MWIDKIGHAGLIVAIAYVVLSQVLTFYLRHAHNDAWLQLGAPTLWNRSIQSSWRYGSWILFSSGFRGLRDPYVAIQIWILRILAALLSADLIAVFIGVFIVHA